jgi:CMP-N,N'-diacetyllegionaminic acid synthase
VNNSNLVFSSKLKVLAVIPARGGSKGVPRKNIRIVAGKPLIAYTIETALAVRHLVHRIVVSTDDEEIAAISRKFGADVPFLRPAYLSGDQVPTLPVLQHAVRLLEAEDHIRFDWILLLQPTAPLRTPRDVETALDLSRTGGTDSVISVTQLIAAHPIQAKRIENNRLLPYYLEEKEGTRRQDLQPPAYIRNGAIYLTRRDVLMEKNSIWGDSIHPYVMPAERSINIDSEMDLKLLELVLKSDLPIKRVMVEKRSSRRRK